MKRPLTQEELSAIDAAGGDVSAYRGEAVEVPDDLYVSPSAKSSAVGAGIKSAAVSAIPTAAGGAGFAGGMKAGLALPIPHPLGKLAAGIIGGLIGGYTSSKLAAKGQEALMPEEWEQSLARSASEHPTATTVGQLATLPLGGLRPSISGTRDVLTALPRLATLGPKGLSAAEAQALKLAAGGAALGAGQEAVVAPLEGRDITAPHLLEAAGLGATFTRPMKFAQKYYGFHDIPRDAVADPESMRGIQQAGRQVAAPVEPTAAPVAAKAVAKPDEVVLPTAKEVAPATTALTAATLTTAAPAAGENRMQFVDRMGSELWRKTDQLRQLRAMLGSDPKYATDKAKIEQQLKDVRAQAEQDPEVHARYKAVDKFMAKNKKKRGQEEGGLERSTLTEEIIGKLKEQGLTAKPSEAYIGVLTDFLKGKNIKVSSNGELEGLKGQALIPNEVREVVFNPEKATIDTLPHEGLHYMREELERSAKQGDKKAAKQLQQWDQLNAEGLRKNNERRATEGKPADDAHEFAVSEQGLEFVKQQFNLLGETPRQRWWNDTVALLKEKWSKNATLEDVRRAVNFRFVNEATRGKYVGKEGPLGPVGKQGIAGLGSARSSEDVDAYNEIQRQMKEVLKSGNLDDFNRLWKENEIIKNRHGGMPPTDEGAQTRNQPEGEGLNEAATPTASKEELKKGEDFLDEIHDTKLAKGGLFDIDNLDIVKRNQPSDEGLDNISSKSKYTPGSAQHALELGGGKYTDKGTLYSDTFALIATSKGKKPVTYISSASETSSKGAYSNAADTLGLESVKVPGGWLYFKPNDPNKGSIINKFHELHARRQTGENIEREFGKLMGYAQEEIESFVNRTFLGGRNQPSDEGLTPPERAGQPGEKPDVEGLKTFITAKLTAQADAAEKAGNTDIASELRAMIKDVENKKQGEDEGLPTDYGEPVGAERILLDAAKRTRPYLEWVTREGNNKRDVSDKAFFRAIMDNDLLRDDIMTEPTVMHALKETTELPAPEPEPVPKAAAVEKVVADITKPEAKPMPKPAIEAPKGKAISEETGQTVTPLKAKESTLISMDEARANAARLANQVLDPGPYAPGVERRGQRAKIPSTTEAESSRRVREASEKYIEERRKKGRFQPEDEGLEGREQAASAGLPTTDVTAQSFVPGLASTFDKVRKLDTQLAEAGANWQARKDSYWGKVQTAEAALSALPDNVVNSAVKKLRDGIKTFTPQEQKAADAWKQYMKWNIEEHNSLGMPVKGIKAFADTEYVPDLLNRKWIDLFTNKPNSAEAQNGKSLWADKAVLEAKGAVTRKEAYRNITSYIEALGRTSKHYTAIDFGGVRKAREYALPEGMRETAAKEILVRYGRSAASDMAMYREMESIPEIQEKLGLRDPVSGKLPPVVEGEPRYSTTKEVQNMMSWVTGSIDEAAITHPYITGTARLVNNLLLGPGTGLRDTASIPVFAVPYLNKFSDLGAFAKGVAHYRENAAAALDTAAVQPHIDRVMMGDIATSPDRFLDILRKAATVARTGQGREAIENFNRKVVFSAGKELARNNVAGAKAGHKGSKQFLERFSTLIDGDVTTMKGKELDSALNQMAKNFVDANQGTYGGTGLPAWVSDSYLAPFLSLQKWSIEKSNTIFKDVVKPFYTGENRVPMLTYMLGSVLTGAGIQKLNEMISNKKASDPTYEEALAKGDASAITSQLATLMQLASYGGIVGDTMKVLSDAAKGKTPRNPLSFPAYSSTADAVTNIKNAANAINDDESPMEVLTELATYLMAHNVQAARLASNFYNADDTARDQRFRDVRVFRELEHKPPTEPITPDRFGGLTARQFKRTGDVGEASEMLPGMIDKIISQSGDDPEEMRKRLRALKGNSYQTFPSMEDTPMAFQSYYDYLIETQGQEAADKRLEDFIKQRMTNRLKARLVPKF